MEPDLKIVNDLMYKIYSIISRESTDIKDQCNKACNVTNSHVRKLQKETYWEYQLKLSFKKDIRYTRKMLTYDFFSFLIDIGSSLGLWFGMSVFGLTDLGIQIFYTLIKSKIWNRQKNLSYC